MACRLQCLHARVSGALTDELQIFRNQANRDITLLQEGIIQHRLLRMCHKCHCLDEEFTHCTRVFLCLSRLTTVSDTCASLNAHQGSLLVAADNAAHNLKGVVESVQDFSVRACEVATCYCGG